MSRAVPEGTAGVAMNPERKDIATEICLRTLKMPRNPTAYEAPQH